MVFNQVRYQYASGQLITCTFKSDVPMGEWSIDQYQAKDRMDELNKPKKIVRQAKKEVKRVPKATSEGLNI